MAPSLKVLTHHSEPTDTELVEWLTHTLDSILNQSPGVIVAVLALVIVAFPLAVALLASRWRRSGR